MKIAYTHRQDTFRVGELGECIREQRNLDTAYWNSVEKPDHNGRSKEPRRLQVDNGRFARDGCIWAVSFLHVDVSTGRHA